MCSAILYLRSYGFSTHLAARSMRLKHHPCLPAMLATLAFPFCAVRYSGCHWRILAGHLGRSWPLQRCCCGPMRRSFVRPTRDARDSSDKVGQPFEDWQIATEVDAQDLDLKRREKQRSEGRVKLQSKASKRRMPQAQSRGQRPCPHDYRTRRTQITPVQSSIAAFAWMWTSQVEHGLSGLFTVCAYRFCWSTRLGMLEVPQDPIILSNPLQALVHVLAHQ